MDKTFTTLLLLFLLIIFDFSISKSNEIQREPVGVFDSQTNTISNIEIVLTNNGIVFNNQITGQGGGIWPRGSNNQYIFSGGIWFGAQKRLSNGTYRKLCVISNNPNSNKSWMVPGRINDGEELDPSRENDNRIYFSTDMNLDGTPKISTDGPNWPIWIRNDDNYLNFGLFVNSDERNSIFYPKGPKYFSDEDIFCAFKDTDLNYYPDGSADALERGYPLRLQWEQNVYCWEDEEKKDMVIIIYKIINTSYDTLFNCWIAPLYDFDIYNNQDSRNGGINDHARYVAEDETLNMGIAWTDVDQGETGKGFGYFSASIIMSPITDKNNYIQNEFLLDSDRHLGLKTFRNWAGFDDVHEDETRYDFISSGIKDGDLGSGDRRMLLASGAFNMLPHDTAYLAVMINFALPSSNDEASGLTEDIAELIEKAKFGKDYFYKNITSIIYEYPKPSNSMLIYPNPALDIINVNLPLINDTKYYIIDILGHERSKGILINGSNQIYVRFLESGQYLLLVDQNNQIMINKFQVVK